MKEKVAIRYGREACVAPCPDTAVVRKHLIALTVSQGVVIRPPFAPSTLWFQSTLRPSRHRCSNSSGTHRTRGRSRIGCGDGREWSCSWRFPFRPKPFQPVCRSARRCRRFRTTTFLDHACFVPPQVRSKLFCIRCTLISRLLRRATHGAGSPNMPNTRGATGSWGRRRWKF